MRTAMVTATVLLALSIVACASTAHASCSAVTLAQAAASLATSAATRERVPLGTLPMPRPVIKDDAEDEFG